MAEVILRAYERRDAAGAVKIWNDITRTGNAFPGEIEYTAESINSLFQEQTRTVCALLDEQVAGFYILHPNNIGRCAHIANASYGVSHAVRGHGIGRRLVLAFPNYSPGMRFSRAAIQCGLLPQIPAL